MMDLRKVNCGAGFGLALCTWCAIAVCDGGRGCSWPMLIRRRIARCCSKQLTRILAARAGADPKQVDHVIDLQAASCAADARAVRSGARGADGLRGCVARDVDMTLNIACLSRHAVYLTGDFRLTPTRPGVDETTTQKIVPVIKTGWCALVAYSGVAQLPSGLDVGRWIAEQSRPEQMREPLADLLQRLHKAEQWLPRLNTAHRWLTICVVGFDGRHPFSYVFSNHLDGDGKSTPPTSTLLQVKDKPRKPTVRAFGSGARWMTAEERGAVRDLLVDNHEADATLHALGIVNARVAERTPTVSSACMVGYIDAAGNGRLTSCGVDESREYIPDFVSRDLAAKGVTSLVAKVDPLGKPLPRMWRGMTFKRQGTPGTDAVAVSLQVFRNVEAETVGAIPNGTALFSQVATDSEPTAYTFKVGDKDVNVRSSLPTSFLREAPSQ